MWRLVAIILIWCEDSQQSAFLDSHLDNEVTYPSLASITKPVASLVMVGSVSKGLG